MEKLKVLSVKSSTEPPFRGYGFNLVVNLSGVVLTQGKHDIVE